ncbi:MAG: flagellar basal body rod protein FlgB [Alphaproteobacteria bacterium]|nr:flagellar basal body rod protein FlgB [Alphaproteobacteria bacterium]
MDLTRLPLFSFITQRMTWLGERQKVLAENIANADTPGYQAKDLKRFDVDAAAHAAGRRLGLAVTSSAHAAGAGATTSYGTIKVKPLETTLSGNTVSVDRELMKSADTAMDYQLVTNLYRKQLSMLRSVLARGS